MPTMARVLWALLVAPATIPVLTFAGYLLIWTMHGMREPVQSLLRASANFAAAVTVIGYIAMGLLGTPVTLWLLRVGRLTRPVLVLSGTIIGSLPTVLLGLRAIVVGARTSTDDARTAFLMALLGAGYGAATAVLASVLIWRKRDSQRPDA